jgi:hypothetical protein
MPNLKDLIIVNDPDFNYQDFEIFEETTLYPKIKEDKRNHNPVLIVLAGTMIWANQCDANVLRQSVSNNTEFLARDYNNISAPLFNYVNEIQEKVFLKKYTKRQLLKEICSFKALNNNWDGYDSLPLEVESAANAMDIIEMLGENIYSPIDKIFPNPNGTISIIWNNDIGETVSLEVGNKTFSYYVDLCLQKTEFFDNIEINDSEIHKLAFFVKKIV